MSDKKYCKAGGALYGLSCGCGIIGGVAGWCLAKEIPDSIGIPLDIGVIKEHWLELSLCLAGVGVIGASSYFYFRWCYIKREDTERQVVDKDENKEADEGKETTGEKNKFEEAKDYIKEKIENTGKNIKRVFVPEDTEKDDRQEATAEKTQDVDKNESKEADEGKETTVEKNKFEEAMDDIKEKFEDAGENVKRVFVPEDTEKDTEKDRNDQATRLEYNTSKETQSTNCVLIMEFEELGIEFKVISEDMEETCLDFMAENFLPDEPISRSLGIKRNWFIDEMYFRDAIKNRTSIVALDKNGNILGARIGHIVKRYDYISWIQDRILMALLPWITWIFGRSTSMKDLWIVFLINKILEFDTWSMFGKLDCDAIYEDKALCSARTHGVRGLGTELVRRTEKLAREKGCSYSFVQVTGIYSARVFDKLGYNKVKQLEYKEFKDGQGQLYLNDTREHTHCTTYLKSLK